jgi:hypothetical protein
MNPEARRIQRTYLTLILGNTIAASFIWGINTLFLLDAGLSNLEAFTANAFFTAGMVIFEVPTGIVADTIGRRMSYLLGTVTLAASTLFYVLLWQIEAPFWEWAVASMLLGLGFTFFSGAVEAWLVDALAAEADVDAALVFDSVMADERTPAISTGARGMVAGPVEVRTGARDLHSGIYGGAVLNATHVLMGILREVLPGPDGKPFDPADYEPVLTEDYELSLALRVHGYDTMAPRNCLAHTDLMPTVKMLWAQRLRWYRGAFESLRDADIVRKPQSLLYEPDVAILPIGDHFTMGPKEAATALELLGVARCIPCHYGTFPLLTGTPEELAQLTDVELLVMEPGQTIDV